MSSGRRVSRTGRPVYTPRSAKLARRSFQMPTLDQIGRWFKLGLLLAGIIGLIVFFRLRELEVMSVNGRRSEQITRTVQANIDKHITWHNLLLINTVKLKNDVLADDFQLRDLDIQRKWPGKLVVRATEKQPTLTWRTTDQTYLLDLDGTIIGPAGEQGARLPSVTDSTNLPVKAGDRVVPARFVAFCSSVIEQMPRKTGLTITGLRVSDTTSEVYITTNKGYYIKFDTTRGAEGQLSDLAAVLAELDKQKKIPAEYIDLRIQHKAYYK